MRRRPTTKRRCQPPLSVVTDPPAPAEHRFVLKRSVRAATTKKKRKGVSFTALVMRTVVGTLLRSTAASASASSHFNAYGRAAACRTSTYTPAFVASAPKCEPGPYRSLFGASSVPLDYQDTSCVTTVRRSFAVAAATAAARRPTRTSSRTVRAAAATSDDTSSDGQQSSEDAAAASPPKRRLAAFDDLFFDATPPPAPARNMPGNNNGGNDNNSNNGNKRPGAAARRPPASYRQRASAIENEEPTQPATAKAFPQPNSPVVKAQQPRKSSSGAKAATPKRNGSGIRTGPKATLASQWQDRAIPPPMEYDYDYYDEEMGVSGYVGTLNGDEELPDGAFLEPPLDYYGGEELPSGSSVSKKVGSNESPMASEAPGYLEREAKVQDSTGDPVVSNINEETATKPPPPSLDRYAEIMATTPSAPPPAVNKSPEPTAEVVQMMSGSSNGNGQMTQVDILTSKSESIKKSVFAENGGEVFNINSPKQVSKVLFGDAGQSTNKDVLDAMASAGNRLADLILQYRQAQRDLKRAKKQIENKQNGIHVDDFHRAPAAAAPAQSSLNADKDSSEMLEFDDANGSNPLLLVDASAYIFRAYYSMPPLHRADGMPVGAVLGFCNMLNRLVLNRSLSGDQPRIVLVFDSNGKNFRHEMYPDYKANRGPCPEDLVPQFDLIREAATAYGIDQIEAPSFEADDVIATLATMAREEGINVHVLSGDKDLMQLVTPPGEEPSINMIDPKEMIRVTYDVVVDKFGVPPNLLGDVLALAGDKSDNIPGVPGIGPKIASTLINEYGSLDLLLECAGEIKQKARREKLLSNTEEAVLSRKLVELDRAVPLDVMTMPDHYTTVSELKMAPLSTEALFNFYEEMGFYDLTFRLRRRLGMSVSDVSQGDSNDNRSPSKGGSAATSSRTDSAPLNDNIRQGLIMHQMRKSAPPKPEDYDDVPF